MTSPTSSGTTSSVSLPSSILSGAQTIDALLANSPRKWGGLQGTGTSVSYSFAWINGLSAVYAGPNGQAYSDTGEPTATYHFGLNPQQQAAARQALAAWASVANLGFYELTESSTQVGDILAIQNLYGANTTANKGDNVYDFDPTKPFYQTLWDTGGQDTISAARFTQPCNINLNDGSYSSLGFKSNWHQYSQLNWQSTPDTQNMYDGTNNLGIAWGVVIENAIGGSGDDAITGNPSDNRLVGGSGNDTLSGGLGNDLLQGDAGNDSLIGGLGTDTAVYLSTRSNYKVEKTSTGWRVTDSVGSDGTDTLQGTERLSFSNRKVALDLDSHAGSVAKIIGVVFGETAVQARPDYVGIGLYYMDTLGYSEQDLGSLALAARLGTAATPEQVVTLLYTNVMHLAPAAGDRDYFVGLLKSGTDTYASLTDLAALTGQNAANIQLAGLSNTGLDYATYTPST